MHAKRFSFGLPNKTKIMKKIVLVLFVGLMGFTLTAQDKGAKIEFKSETVDYGEVGEGRGWRACVRVHEYGRCPADYQQGQLQLWLHHPEKAPRPYFTW